MSHHARDLANEAAAARALLAHIAESLDLDEDTASDTVEGETGLMEAIDRAIDRIGEIESHTEAIAARVEALRARSARLEASAGTLRALIRHAMEQTGLTKIERPAATMSIRASPRKVIIGDEAAIPQRFWRVPPPVLDKLAIAAALKDGVEVAGAALSNGGQSLTLRFR